MDILDSLRYIFQNFLSFEGMVLLDNILLGRPVCRDYKLENVFTRCSRLGYTGLFRSVLELFSRDSRLSIRQCDEEVDVCQHKGIKRVLKHAFQFEDRETRLSGEDLRHQIF